MSGAFKANPREQAPAQLALRDEVLRSVLFWFALGGVLNGAVALAQVAKHGAPITLWIGLALLPGLGVFAIVQPRLGFERTLRGFLGYLLGVCGYFQCFRGMIPGTVLADVAFLMLSGLFFGKRGLVWGCVLLLASLIVAASLAIGQWLDPWDPSLWDPRDPLVWLRYGVVFAFYGGAVASGLVRMIAGLEASAARARETLVRERAERAERERLQLELERAHRIEAMGQLAAGMAHDFNNSLSVIVSGLNLIRTDPSVSAEVVGLAEEVSQRARLTSDSVRQLLSLGRRQDCGTPECTRLDALLRRALPMLQQATGSGVSVSLEAVSEACVSIDLARMQQAILNLAVNARDAMPHGGRWQLRVYDQQIARAPVGWTASPGMFAVFECKDTGVGLEPELREKIFEPFFTTKPTGQGSGLGLAMVRKTILDARGFIEVESTPGEGTCFRIHLPAHVEPPQA